MSRTGVRDALRRLWRHVPIPEQHVVPITIGLFAQARRPLRLSRRLEPLGWLILAIGLLTNIVAVHERGRGDIDKPERLATDGLHGLTRNPMYVGWSGIHFGLALVLSNGWILTMWPLSVALTHRGVMVEERQLVEQFGEEYATYMRRVPRYFPFPSRDRPQARYR